MKFTKFLTIPVFMFIFSLCTNGQTEAGKVLIGGCSSLGLGLTSSRVKTDNDNGTKQNSTVLDLSPQIGFFVSNGLAIGFVLPIQYVHLKYGSIKYSSTTLGLAPFVKYYYGPGKVKPFIMGEVGLNYTFDKTKSSYSSDSDDSSLGFSGIAGCGLAVFLNEKVSLDIMLGYQYLYSKQLNDNPDNQRSVYNSFTGQVGIIVIL